MKASEPEFVGRAHAFIARRVFLKSEAKNLAPIKRAGRFTKSLLDVVAVLATTGQEEVMTSKAYRECEAVFLVLVLLLGALAFLPMTL